jgi:serine/threonine protein phosphatase PrpC
MMAMSETPEQPVLSTTSRQDSYRGEDSEDRSAIIASAGSQIFVVADGVGGRAGGFAAASLLVDLVREVAPQITRLDAPAWARFLTQADKIVAEDDESGETTGVIAQVSDDGRRIVGASIGDSEAWFVTPDGLFDLTETQRKKPFLGSGGAGAVPFTLPTPDPGGTLLIASDGLFKYADQERIIEAVRSPDLEDAATALVDSARLRSGSFSDDIAVLLCRIAPGRKQTLWERITTR